MIFIGVNLTQYNSDSGTDEPERIYHKFTIITETEPRIDVTTPEGEQQIVNGNIIVVETPFVLEIEATLPFSWFGSCIPTAQGTGPMKPTSVSVNPKPVPNIMKTQEVKFIISGTRRFRKEIDQRIWNSGAGTVTVEMGEYYTYH